MRIERQGGEGRIGLAGLEGGTAQPDARPPPLPRLIVPPNRRFRMQRAH